MHPLPKISGPHLCISFCLASLLQVHFAWSGAKGEALFPALTERLGRLPNVIDLWEAVELCRMHLGRGSDIPMPQVLEDYLAFIRVRITEAAGRPASLTSLHMPF
jgi:hypothetical protein